MRSGGLRRRRGEGADPLSLSGWLFAELAMVLVIIALGTQFNPLAAASDEPPQPPPPVTTPTLPTTSAAAEGLSLKPETFVVHVPPGGGGAGRAFAGELQRRNIGDGDVGLMLLFGVSRDGVLGNGVLVSQDLAAAIRRVDPPQLAPGVVIREFLAGTTDGRPGDVTVDLYLFTGDR